MSSPGSESERRLEELRLLFAGGSPALTQPGLFAPTAIRPSMTAPHRYNIILRYTDPRTGAPLEHALWIDTSAAQTPSELYDLAIRSIEAGAGSPPIALPEEGGPNIVDIELELARYYERV